MRPPSVYANLSCPAGCPCDVLRLLHGPHRVGARLVMILLSGQGWTAAAIAELLGCDPVTVRRWIHRYNQDGTGGLADHPRAGRPRLGSPRLGERIGRLLAQPGAWTISRLYQRLGCPAMSLRTLHRRVREVAAWRRPRLVAKGDPDRDQVLAELQQTITELPAGAVVPAEDETHRATPVTAAVGRGRSCAAPSSASKSSGSLPGPVHRRCCGCGGPVPANWS